MNKTRQWTVFTAVAVLVVLVGGWMLLISPQRSKAKDLDNQATSAQQQVTRLHAQLAQLLAQKRNLPEQQKILAQIATKIPGDPAEPTLIRQLQGAAHTAGVDLSQLNPSTPTQVTAPTGATATTATTTTATASTATASTPLWQIPIAITVNGSYFNVEMFEHSLEQLPRAMLVTGMTIVPDQAASGSSSALSGSTAGSGSGASQPNPGDVSATINATVFLSPQASGTTAGVPTTTGSGASAAGSTGK